MYFGEESGMGLVVVGHYEWRPAAAFLRYSDAPPPLTPPLIITITTTTAITTNVFFLRKGLTPTPARCL